MTYKEFEQKLLEKKKDGKVLCIAHRGFSGVALENSLESIKKGLETAYVDGIEFDLQRTSDNHIVLRHNKSLKTKNGYVWITDISFDELRVYLSEEECPEFENVLKLWKDSSKIMDIEMKSDGMAKQVIDLCKSYNLYKNVIFSSLFYTMHKEILSLDPLVARMYGYPRDRGKDIAQRKWMYPIVSIIVRFMKVLLPFKIENMFLTADTMFISFYHKIITKNITKTIHDRGRYLIGVVINLNGDTDESVAKNEIAQLLECGVDAIKTDYPHLIR